MKLLSRYKNNNYFVNLFSNGTKTRFTKDDEFVAEFPESIDFSITDWCDIGCEFCYKGCSTKGKHGDIMNLPFIDTLIAGSEIALGGGKLTSHPELVPFLHKLKQKGIIASVTVHQYELENNIEFIEKLINEKLIYGIGISFKQMTPILKQFLDTYSNAVLHMINGIHTLEDFKAVEGYKVLILGYKTCGRGIAYGEENAHGNEVMRLQQDLYNELPKMIKKYKVVSFDNLGIVQLEVKRVMSEKEWDEFYMGDDGQFTMYVDAVSEKFSRSSLQEKEFDLMDNIVDMFKIVKEL